jgi:predicted nuclease with TOPRIM domain
MRKGKNRYIVEVNEWGCGLMIKDTQTGREIDAPEDEVITLCIREMNSLAKELDTVRSVAEDNQAELKATRIENARLKAECQARQAENSVLAVECERLKAEVERLKQDNRQLTKAFEIAEGIIKRMGKAAEDAAKEGKQS